MTREICVAGNRRVAFEIGGSAAGTPVFLLHGTPGSRSGPRPRSSVLYRLGIRCSALTGLGTDDPTRSRAGPLPMRPPISKRSPTNSSSTLLAWSAAVAVARMR